MKCNITIEIDELTVKGSAHVELVLTLRKLADELAQIQAFEGHRGIHRKVHATNGDAVGRIDADGARPIWDGRLLVM